MFQLLFSFLLSVLSAGKVVGFVVREDKVEEVEDLQEKHEVRVTYGDELENILRKAANEGRESLVEEILSGEVSLSDAERVSSMD